jgi:hypothetical protein
MLPAQRIWYLSRVRCKPGRALRVHRVMLFRSHPMKSTTLALALLGATFSLAASAMQVNEYSAGFVHLDDGTYRINGFGRGSSAGLDATPQDTAALEPFFDTWNLDTSDIAPGQYSFSSFIVDAAGGLVFTSMTLSSYDEAGHRNTVLFSLNDSGTQATGSGQFTVLSTCPVQSCLWIDVVGLQPPGSAAAGYGDGGLTTVTQVPEPATNALWALGLLGLAGALRRRAPAVRAVH